MGKIIKFLAFGQSKWVGSVIGSIIAVAILVFAWGLLKKGFEAKFLEPYAKPYKDSLVVAQDKIILLDSLNSDLSLEVLILKQENRKDSLNWEEQKVAFQRTIQNVRSKALKEVEAANDSLDYYKTLVGKLKSGTACQIESKHLLKKNRVWILVDCETKEPI